MEGRDMKAPVLELSPNRVRRNYRGGILLDQIEGRKACADGNQPEDWLASTTPAINPGMPTVANEGLGRVSVNGQNLFLSELFGEHGGYYLGDDHMRREGANLGFLAKILDSGMRLQTQAHPTKEFARKHLNSPWGKLECYVILGIRPGFPGGIRLGFQNAPTRDEWREILKDQDFPRMDACFESIPVRPGEVWLVPGGMVHALGAGLLLLEVMEPSDLVVRCEFERDGAIVPPEARFMGRDLEFCLDIFDYTARSVTEIESLCRMAPRTISSSSAHEEELLLARERTECFSVRRLVVRRPFRWQPGPGCARLAVVTEGRGVLNTEGRRIPVAFGSRFLTAAQGGEIAIEPEDGRPLVICWCQSSP
jgi:mannose-6-phosphate isomerase